MRNKMIACILASIFAISSGSYMSLTVSASEVSTMNSTENLILIIDKISIIMFIEELRIIHLMVRKIRKGENSLVGDNISNNIRFIIFECCYCTIFRERKLDYSWI